MPASWAVAWIRVVADGFEPRVIRRDLNFNPPSWYVSALLLMWLLENASFALAARVMASEWAWLVAGLLVWVAAWPWARLWDAFWDPEWLAIPALNFLHFYFAGVALAVLVHQRAARRRRRRIEPGTMAEWSNAAAPEGT